MNNFAIPFVQQETPLVSSKKASEDAFYAAASSSENPIEDYSIIKTDLEQTGTSEIMNMAQSRWEQETEQANKDAIVGIINDETISPELKKSIVQSYSLTGAVPTSLKDKYIVKQAARDLGTTLDDTVSQDIVASTLEARKANNANLVNQEKVEEGSTDLLNIIQGTAGVASSILLSIPAGFAGLYQVIKEQDSSKGADIVSSIQQAGYMPDDEASKHVMESILHAAQTLGIPAQWVGNKALELTGSPALATASEIILDPINFIPIGKLASITKKSVKGTPKVADSSPLATTAMANPTAAAEAAKAVIADTTGKVEEALGATKGDVIHDWVLPKLPGHITKDHPDLAAEILATDAAVAKTFQDFRYDPSIIEVTKREEEVGKVLQITRESRTPYYNQSMSIINETDELFEGNAVYGRKNGDGYVRESDARKGYESLKESIKTLPEELQGTLDIVKHDGKYYINHQWKREYDELSSKVFGRDSIQTSMLGFDVSGIARSSLGRHIWSTGRFPKWVENGALTGIEHTAVIKNSLVDIVKNRVANTKHGVELDYLIREAEETGTDFFSKAKIGGMFPKLSASEVDELFTTHTYWNRLQQYNHNFMNREVRHRMTKDDMQGIYDNAGNYIGAATSKVGPAELGKINEVWDFEKGIPVKYDAEQLAKEGKTVVRLHEKVETDGAVHTYAVLGTKHQLNLLPQEVLPRLPGYSGRKVIESWYVDIIPKEIRVNGVREVEATGVRSYSRTRAAARTEAEANKIAEQLMADNPDHLIEVRPERQDTFGRVMTDYSIHQEQLRHSMKRGERLPSLNGPARIEDRMVTLLNTVSSLSRMGAFRAWDNAFQSAFVKGFAKFTEGQFPQYATDIKPLENMGRGLKQEYDTAHAMFKYYERLKNNETTGDFLYTKGLHAIADILEKWKVPVDVLRGKKQNPLMIGKTIATTAYIHLAPLRQHLIQPIQQLEMYLINPSTASKSFANTAAVRFYLSAESKMVKTAKSTLQENAIRMAKFKDKQEFLDVVDAIRNSGMLQSVDMNSIVHGIFKEVDRNLVENVPEKIWKDIETTVKAPVRLARSLGFDAAELNNRVGNWLQVREMWMEKNPGKDWKTKEAKAEISAEAIKLSGAMNRAGALPYQEGMLSIFFQFAAINHKMLMNTLQDNATILSPTQRAKLAAVRFALYGGKYGIPGGAIAYAMIERTDDQEVKDNAELIKRGLIDKAANGLLSSVVEPDNPTDLALSKILSPYSEGFMPYFAVGWETLKLFDDAPAGPRYPAFGMISSFGQAAEDIQGWWTTREVNEKNFKQMAFEAAEVASGFNSYTQGLLMLGMRDKVTKNGNKYGLEFTVAEAYAKMTLGIGTQKEEDLWKLVELERDISGQKHEMAKVIHRQMLNQRVKGNEENYADHVRKLNSFISMLDSQHFSEADKIDVITELEKLDRKSYTTIKQSILVDHWKYHQEQRTEEWKRVDDILRRSTDPEIQRYIEALDKGNE